MSNRRVVVTGIGAITPIGNNLKDYWSSLTDGKGGAGPITLFDASNFKTKFACEVKNFNPNDFIDRKQARKLDRFCQFAVVVADQAFSDSGLSTDKINGDRAGVIWGSGIGGMNTFYSESVSFGSGNGTPRFNPFFIPKLISDIPAGHISIKYGFRGPNFTTVSACASSTHALIDAYNNIKWDKADLFIAGGSEACVLEPGIGGVNAMMALSTRNDDPQSASRPWDVDRDGFVLGDGAGMLMLESLDSARARGARVYCELSGFGMSGDAYHMTSPPEDGRGAAAAMQQALTDASLNTSDVGYVNAHGTSTEAGDLAESLAIRQVFGHHADDLAVSSTKSMIGHLLGAAGSVEAILSVLALQHNVAPPTINLQNPSPGCDLNYVPNLAQERPIGHALSNSFGFGGTNGSLIFSRLD